VFTVLLPSNNRLHSFHCSGFRYHVTLLYLTETENVVEYWVLAAAIMKLAIFKSAMLPGALLPMLQAPEN
jgi:hypothetical protein